MGKKFVPHKIDIEFFTKFFDDKCPEKACVKSVKRGPDGQSLQFGYLVRDFMGNVTVFIRKGEACILDPRKYESVEDVASEWMVD